MWLEIDGPAHLAMTTPSPAASRSPATSAPTVEAQRSLAGQEAFINAVLDVEGALVTVLDCDGKVVRFNGAAERLSGYSSAEVLGRTIWDLVPSSEVGDVLGVIANLHAGAFPSTYENHWVTRSGVQRLIRWENTCLTDERGSVTHVIATGIDITEARRGEDAVRGIEAVGRLLAEQGPVPHALDAVLGELRLRMGYEFLSPLSPRWRRAPTGGPARVRDMSRIGSTRAPGSSAA